MESTVRIFLRALAAVGVLLALLPLGVAQAKPPQPWETWALAGNMNDHRNQHTATLLDNGTVLAAGGVNETHRVIGTTELFDPKAETWSFTGSMNTPRAIHTATLLDAPSCRGRRAPEFCGKVLVVGGEDRTYSPLASAELYDPVTRTWSPTGSMRYHRLLHTATLLKDGKVLVTGGASPDSPGGGFARTAELYDPETGTWSSTGSMNIGRELHTATLLKDGKVLVAGGFEFIDLPAERSAELYDPSTGTWRFTGSMELRRGGHTATLLDDGKVLVAGGTSFRLTETYNPSTGQWRQAGLLNVPRGNHTATLLRSGKVLVAGGLTSVPLDSAELWDPSTRTWNVTGSLNIARGLHTATLIDKGKQVLVAGGASGGISLDSAELFRPRPN